MKGCFYLISLVPCILQQAVKRSHRRLGLAQKLMNQVATIICLHELVSEELAVEA